MRAPRLGIPTGRRSPRLYHVLLRLQPSPVIELDAAVALSMVEGPERALRLVNSIGQHGGLNGYHVLPGRAWRSAAALGSAYRSHSRLSTGA